ncbi:MAG TPA: SDR family NAD(P)-dependent oxidoreductase [Chloroflexota bacterium]|nr:SDR family NAD(P)-dependent oxidoreductase [Chloroflexota bacterium]
METGLAGKVAVITGGAGALARACAWMLAAEGARLAVADLDPGAVERAAEELRAAGHEARGVALDVTRKDQARTLVRRVLDDWGRLDVLVNCAGIFHAAPFEEIDVADWQRVLDVNLTGMFLCCQAVLPVMRAQGSGRIINFGSLAGQVGGLAAGADYSASKAAVNCLTKSIARALGACGVTVNTINPGPVDSPMVDAWPEGQREAQLQRIPLGRLGRPEDIAAAVVFLASDAAAYIHGTHLDVNGGLHMA